MSEQLKLKDWLQNYWVIGAGFMAAALLTLTPIIGMLSLPLLLIFLHSPGYMIHQVEEHTGDRFRTFANTRVFGGCDALSVTDVLVINLPLVWGINLAALYAAAAWGAGWGLVAPYTVIVNAIAHIGATARFRCYNPGLVTSVLLFLPLGIVTLFVVSGEPGVGLAHHLLGLGLAILLHVGIIVAVLRRYRTLEAAAKASA